MKSKVLLFSLLFTILISQQINAQCSVTTSPTINASALICGTAPLSSCNGILYIGDGTNPTTITMNAVLDLTCLGAIQLIVRNNATLDFSSGNDYLLLDAGSSIIFQPGAGLTGQSCNASERIYIGGVLIASCNGNAGADYSFLELLTQGGYNIVRPTASPTAICGSGSFVLTANPVPSKDAEVSWYDAPTGGNLLLSNSNTYTTPVISATTIYYAEAYYPPSEFTTPRVSITAAVNPISTWNGSSWSIPPTPASSLIFSGNYSSTGNLSGCSCTVNSGSVVFNAGHTLNLINELNVAGGTLTFNNTASLVQVNNTTNTGDIIYNRNSTPVVKFDYTFWSSPTSGTQTLLSFSPNTSINRFFTYHNSWLSANPSADVFVKGLGYAIWVPQSTSPSVPTVLPHQFVGVPNNGDVDINVSLGPPISNRLLGNPYPSTLDANAFINANIVGIGTINQTISGTLYFWTHNHSLTGNNYSQADYATYNLSGGTAVSTGTGNTTAPTQYIAAGQGIFINQVSNGNVSFRNNMRIGTNNTNFYKNSNTEKSEKTLEKHRIWLNLTNNNSNFSQALVGYIETATNGYNSGFDGLYFGNNEFAIYSLLKNDAYAIQARALPFSDVDEVSIGFMTNISGELSIGIDHLDGLFLEGQKVYLEDKLLKTMNDITDAPYQFTANKGTTNNRFVLRYTNKTANNADLNLTENVITVFASNHEIKINSSLESIKNYTIYNVLGQILITKNNVNTNQSVVNSIIENNQALIVKIVLENGQTETKKIIF